MMKRFLMDPWLALLALALVGSVMQAQAAPIFSNGTLQDLINLGSTGAQVGDKVFSNFTYTPSGNMPLASAVNVTSILSPNIGLMFQGGFGDSPGGGPSDALITYTVTVTDPTRRITDAHMDGNPAVVGATTTNPGTVSVTETFLPDSTKMLNIFDNEPGSSTKLSDDTTFTTPLSVLHVQKDIRADAGAAGTGVTATLSFVDQTFSQTAVPEPATIALVLAGVPVAGILALRRRKAKA
jgi:hypothetical protein